MSTIESHPHHDALRRDAEDTMGLADADPRARALAEQTLALLDSYASLQEQSEQQRRDLVQARRDAEDARHVAEALTAEDRYASGYSAARRHYRSDRAVAMQTAEAWRDPQQDRGREVIRQVWPDLAAALDATTSAADEMEGRA